MEHPEEVPDFQLWTGAALAIVSIWSMNQHKERKRWVVEGQSRNEASVVVFLILYQTEGMETIFYVNKIFLNKFNTFRNSLE